ncbi:hypothetical protein [Mycobacterium sp. NPDC050853]|uniref:hypothetical protein n=1 Tax=Mycobacterium sp. NPDC050853 TaxID=3155160 RepID=UPI0033FFD25B
MTTSVTVGVGAGTGASATISGNDFSGTITVTAGTSPAAGVFATVAFANAYGAAPQVFIEAMSAAGATLATYISTASATGFTLSTGSAPSASTGYTLQYYVMGQYASSGQNTWTWNSDGSASFNGTTKFVNGTNLASGMGVVIMGPTGGQANFPGVQEGPPGPPATIAMTATIVPYGTTLQSPNPAVTNPAPGVYIYNLQVPAGQQGPAGIMAILAASDLEGVTMPGTPPANKSIIAFDAPNSKVQFVDPRVGGVYATTVASTTASAGQGRPLSAIAVPALPYAWWPEVFAPIPITAADNTSQVNLVARVGNATSGDQCGISLGTLGALSYTASVKPAFGAVLPGLSTAGAMGSYYGAVPAGTAANIYLRAEQQAATTSGYATGAGYFTLKVNPVP